ncbi:MAG: serine hydrolase domain-containing protein, partial [Gemmatimonadota bacterium]|nr:serine hydrolase domain-containing protein [Gemmatimonadota bacterium]
TTETKFRIGSISKSLTSAAVGLLVERGLLELDAPVQTYVPDFPEKTHPITTRQLAGHQSGIPHYGSEDFQNFEPYEGVFHALDKFKDRELLFVPGERFEYSSFGFNLVSAVVQGASGRQFVDFMHDEVFEPLGMPNTVPDDYRMIVANRTGFYEPLEGGAVGNAPFTDNSDVWAGGGYLSTPTDLARFGRGLLEGELLATETVELLWTAQRTTGGEETPYGIGWFVRTNDADEKVVSHGGAHFGASAQLVILPSRRLIVAITANMSGANVGERLGQILELFEALASPASGS